MPALGVRRLLCPSDFSAQAQRALGVAVELAERQRGELRALYVSPPEGVSGASGRERLERFVEAARTREVAVSVALQEGDPASRIAAEAAAWAADLVVMGSRGCAGGRWAVGSVTERMLHSSPCPVLVVARPEIPQLRAFAPSHILCPYDFSDSAERALEYAAALARVLGAKLTLLQVLEWFSGEEPRLEDELTVPELQIDLAEGARSRLEAVVPADLRGPGRSRALVAAGRPHRAVLRVADERGVDLIVLGVHCGRELDRSLFGSTMNHVVREAVCPVLAVPVR